MARRGTMPTLDISRIKGRDLSKAIDIKAYAKKTSYGIHSGTNSVKSVKINKERKKWLALGIEKRARALSNLNALRNTEIYSDVKYLKNEARIARALSNMKKKASITTKGRGAVAT